VISPLPLLFIAAALPGLVWDQPVDKTAAAIRPIEGITVYVPAKAVTEWRSAGIATVEPDTALRDAVKARAPGVQYRMDVAAATSAPWLDWNGWRIVRSPDKIFYYDTPQGRAALAAAEAWTWDAKAAIHIAPADLQAFAQMIAFLRANSREPMPALVNLAVVDDGTPLAGEAMNLIGRRNLLFKPVTAAPKSGYDLVVKVGSKEFPVETARNPGMLATEVRARLGDDKRLVRVYGSQVVVTRLTGAAGRARLVIINYGNRSVEGLRVRVLGSYTSATAAIAAVPDAKLHDVAADSGAIEFTVDQLPRIAVIDFK
jgi:hypothetical protein